jgi:3-oxoacyl-[acyl-carrier protein] reductase
MTKTDKGGALITGASRGIGAAIARRLAQDGFAIGVNYASGEAEAFALVEEIETSGGRATAIRADVSQPAEAARMFEIAVSALGSLDAVVSNAGMMQLAPIAAMTDEMFDKRIAINLKGTFNVLREAARHIRDGGSIITLSSSVTRLRTPTYGPYAATKAAVEVLTTVLSKELRGRRITVNAVAPGPTATDLFLQGKSPGLIETIAKASPFERLGEPGDIASAVSMLAGPDGEWINGQTIFVNGGVA